MTAALTCLMASRYPDPATLVRGSEAMRPNLALIVLDTVRADHLSLYGYGRETMPAFERWAQTALVVDRAVSPAGWTSPAYASLFSGLTVSKHGLHYSADASPTAALATSAREDVVWLPERLQEMGYYCLAVSANAIAVPPSGAGFDRILTPDRNAWNGFTIGGLADRLVPFTARLSERLRWRMPYAGAKAVADAAIRALPLDAGPTFLFVNFVDAHSPYNPPADAVEALGLVPPPGFSRYKYHTDLTREWTLLPQSAKERLSELYDAELRGLDGELDRLLRELEIRLGPDALIVVTSDHGEELGEEGRVGHEFGLSQSLIHVPLLVKSRRLGPGRLEGPVSTRRVHDLLWRTASGEAPSISEWTAAQPAIAERYPSGTNARTLGAEYRRAWTALVSRNEKGVGPSESGFEATALGDDFHSSGELAGAEAEELRKAVDGYWRSSRDERNAGRALRKEDLDRLRSLGYIN